MTYAQLARAITDVGARIASDRVAVMMDNGVPWAVVDLTIAACGAVAIPVPTFFSGEQIEHLLTDAAPDLLITDRPGHAVGLSRVSHHGTIVIANTTIHLYALQVSGRRTLPSDTGKITYTSGTTQQPKGVCATRAAIDEVSEALAVAAGANAEDRSLTVLPLSTLLANIGGPWRAALPDPVAPCVVRPSQRGMPLPWKPFTKERPSMSTHERRNKES